MSQSRRHKQDETDGGETTEDSPYEMSLSLNVLNHLGLNLYSNVPAVLSEAVANAWDADAENVGVRISPKDDRIKIADDGCGMGYRDVNRRYLRVGYRRREDESQPNRTPKHNRPVMGRKGIGKLSLLSIAETVDVYTTDGDERHAFRMNVDDIKEAIGEEGSVDDTTQTERYTPQSLDDFPSGLESGTRIVLRNLKKRVHTTETALRKRLARRFSILGAEYDFSVTINGTKVDVADRDYFHKVQFLWTYGDDSYAGHCRDHKLQNHESRPRTTREEHEIKGWIGTVEMPSDLVEKHPGERTEADDLNKISLIVRGRMAKPDLLEDFNDSRMYTKYLVGEIHADFLDSDSAKDIATSNREDIVKEDPRYRALLEFLGDELNRIANRWDALRNDQGSDAAREIQSIDMWYESLSPENREQARQLFGKINRMTVDEESDRREMFKHGVLAFENLKSEENLQRLDDIAAGDTRELAHAVADFDDGGKTRYDRLVSQRAKLVGRLRREAAADALDDRIWARLRDRPWFLSPSWERSTADEGVQHDFERQFDAPGDVIETGTDASKPENPGPPTYLRTAGEHLLVDLLPPRTTVSVRNLVPRIEAARTALRRALELRNVSDTRIHTVVVVGSLPTDYRDSDGDNRSSQVLREQYDARIETYERLLTETAEAYESYLDRDQRHGRVSNLIEMIDTDGAFE